MGKLKSRLFLPGKKEVIPIKLFSIFIGDKYRKYGFIFTYIMIIIFVLISDFTVIAEKPVSKGELGKLRADSISTSFLEGSVEEVIAEGNTLMIYDNYRIESDFIKYQMQSEDVFIKGDIVLTTDQYKLYTAQMTGNLDSMELKAVGDVQFKGDDGLDINSRELLVQEKKQMMKFMDNVLFKYGEIEAVADTATYYSEKEIVILEGNVTANRGDLQLSGEKLEVNLENEKMRLLGKAELLFRNEGEE